MRTAPTLTPRLTPARARITCSDTGFEARVDYERRPAASTAMQRMIERSITLPSTGFTVRLGELELFFRERDVLASVGAYARLNQACLCGWREVASRAPPMEMGFPALDASEHVHSLPAVVVASVDKALARLSVTVGPPRPSSACLLADDLLVQVDAAGCIAGFQARNIVWTDDLPVDATGADDV